MVGTGPVESCCDPSGFRRWKPTMTTDSRGFVAERWPRFLGERRGLSQPGSVERLAPTRTAGTRPTARGSELDDDDSDGGGAMPGSFPCGLGLERSGRV